MNFGWLAQPAVDVDAAALLVSVFMTVMVELAIARFRRSEYRCQLACIRLSCHDPTVFDVVGVLGSDPNLALRDAEPVTGLRAGAIGAHPTPLAAQSASSTIEFTPSPACHIP